jgi:S-adenosylmethionine hydrolase
MGKSAASGIVTLTTDFGLADSYVGEMKGAILGRFRGATIVDLCHAVRPQDVRHGAFLLEGAWKAFPEGTVHLAVVDPGVGTGRRLLAASARGHWFVGPDNGLLWPIVSGDPEARTWSLDAPQLRRAPASATFHGRDILGPAAAYLADGGDPDALGRCLGGMVPLPGLEADPDGDGFRAEVIHIDRFGNLVTNLRALRLEGLPRDRWEVCLGGAALGGLARTYGEHPAGSLIALEGSNGWLEVAAVDGNAAAALGLGPGSPVAVRPLVG